MKIKHKIEVDIDAIEYANVRDFIRSEIEHCEKNKITVEMLVSKVEHDGIECSGVFCDEPMPKLTVNCNKTIDDWLLIFIHETCHKDQFLEKSATWTNRINNEYDALQVFDMWVSHTVELKRHQMRPVLQQIVDIELDCEQRSVAKIKKYNLPVNVEEYIQKSNAYIWYYHAVAHYRSYSQRTSPYMNSDLWSQMPLDFNNNYSKIKNKMLKHYSRHCW